MVVTSRLPVTIILDLVTVIDMEQAVIIKVILILHHLLIIDDRSMPVVTVNNIQETLQHHQHKHIREPSNHQLRIEEWLVQMNKEGIITPIITDIVAHKHHQLEVKMLTKEIK